VTTVEPTTDPQDDDPETARPVMRQWHKTKAASKRESEARRARVLAHDDLAQRLTLPPLRLTTPARWSGWDTTTDAARGVLRPLRAQW
jgi:hypothetical protein